MARVIGVRFRDNGKIYYFASEQFEVEVGQNVIVETARGVEYGRVVLGNEPFFYSISYYKKYKRYSADSDGYSSYAETSFVCTDYRNWWNY